MLSNLVLNNFIDAFSIIYFAGKFSSLGSTSTLYWGFRNFYKNIAVLQQHLKYPWVGCYCCRLYSKKRCHHTLLKSWSGLYQIAWPFFSFENACCLSQFGFYKLERDYDKVHKRIILRSIHHIHIKKHAAPPASSKVLCVPNNKNPDSVLDVPSPLYELFF